MLYPPVANPAKVRRDSVKALRQAWPHRQSLRGKIVVRANVAMLRRLEGI
jgi:hypothetical protein